MPRADAAAPGQQPARCTDGGGDLWRLVETCGGDLWSLKACYPPPGPQAPLPQASLQQPQMLGMQPPMSMPMPCMPSGVMPNYFGSGAGLLTPPWASQAGCRTCRSLASSHRSTRAAWPGFRRTCSSR